MAKKEPFDPGRMRFRVRLQQLPVGDPIPEPGGAGDQLLTWEDVESPSDDGLFSAAVEPISGRELVNAKSVRSVTMFRVWMRNNVRILAGRNRIIFRDPLIGEDRILDIDGVTGDLERNGYHEMTAIETN